MPASPLLLTIVDYTDAYHWRWQLIGGDVLTEHAVAIDPKEAEYQGFVDLPGYLHHLAAPDQEEEDNRRNLGRFGNWLTPRVFGPIMAAMAERAPVTVQVRVPRNADHLVLRPFEAARIGNRPLALAGVSLVFEVADDPAEPVKLPVGESLRMLAVFSLPPGKSPLNLRAERQMLRRLVKKLPGVELRTLQYGTSVEVLKAALEEPAGWDIVHFSGHGEPGTVLLEGPNGKPAPVNAEDLAEILRPARNQIKLVTVSACLSAAASLKKTQLWLGIDAVPEDEDGGSASPVQETSPVARQLVRVLDCAVLAMRFEVGDWFAIAFAKQLYQQLLIAGASLPAAVRTALTTIAGPETSTGELSALAPALFGRRAALLGLTVPPNTSAIQADAFRLPPERERFVGRVAVMTRASEALAKASERTGVLFHGMAGAGKSACALELVHHLAPTGRFQHIMWYKAPDQGHDTASALVAFATALDRHFSDLAMVQVVGREEDLAEWLPHLHQVLKNNAILIVIDNLESLLTDGGAWREVQFGRIISALFDHDGLSRTVLTSRIAPADLSTRVQITPIHALPLNEALMLMWEMPRLGRLYDIDTDLFRKVLTVVQGHPKLTELAEGQAGDIKALATRIKNAEQAWLDGDNPLKALFAKGESAVTDTAFVAALAEWTGAVVATLPDASRTLFHFLCVTDDGEREDWIIEAAWSDLWSQLRLPEPPPSPDEALIPLTATALVESLVESVEDRVVIRYALHPGVAAAGRAAANEDLFQANGP